MTLAERTHSCLLRMIDAAKTDDDEWSCYWAEFLGLTGQPVPTGYEKDERIQSWWARGREDREVLLGLQSVEDAQN